MTRWEAESRKILFIGFYNIQTVMNLERKRKTKKSEFSPLFLIVPGVFQLVLCAGIPLWHQLINQNLVLEESS